MRITKKTMVEIAERFEAALDYVPALDKVPFHLKREAANHAAAVVHTILTKEEQSS